MGNDFCSCLSDLTTPESEDLSRKQNSNVNGKKIDNHPKIILNQTNTIESNDPVSSQRETTISSIYKKNSIVSLRNSNYKQNKKDKKKIINLKGNINNKKNNKFKNNKKNDLINIDTENIIEKKSSVKNLKKEGFVNEKFKNFFNTPQGQEMTLNMNDHSNKLCIALHKYLLSLITKREFKKNIKYYIEEGNNLYKNCLDEIYNSNPKLKKEEINSPIKYSPDGYLKYYSEKKDIEQMKFNNSKESFDNCIIISYSENNPTSINNMIWIYKGQSNKSGEPHGFGEKLFKNGIKQKGYWKNGEMFGWCEEIDSQGNITIGPFYDNEGITGKGEKYTLKKKILYVGEFKKGQKSGMGEENSIEGKFVGNFYKDKKYGKGKMIYNISGDIYEGEYKDDLFNGNGHYIWKTTGQEYKGEYKNGLMHGKGLFEWSEGEYYRGNFVDGKKEGEGELHMGNGRSFIGPFSNGRPNGIGIFDNGIDFKGEMEFIDGKMNIDYMKRKYTNTSLASINIDNDDNNDNKNKEDLK
jgi:hypothetical protein